MIEFQNCANKETKYFLGCTMLGIVLASISALTLWPLVHLSIGFGSSFPMAFVGNRISMHLHEGNIQRWIYWNLSCFYSLPKPYINRYW